jgi:hypothetical protein
VRNNFIKSNHNKRENDWNDGSNQQAPFSVNSHSKYPHALQKAWKNVRNKTNLDIYGINTKNEHYVQVPNTNLTFYQKCVY